MTLLQAANILWRSVRSRERWVTSSDYPSRSLKGKASLPRPAKEEKKTDQKGCFKSACRLLLRLHEEQPPASQKE